MAAFVAAPWVLWAVLRTFGLERGHPLVALLAFSPYAAALADGRGETLVVMTANLRFGNGDPAALVRLVRRHDVEVLSLQELTPDALRRLDAAGAAELLPGRAVRPDVSWWGLGLMARAPLRDAPPRPGSPQTRLEALLSPDDGATLRLVAVHPLAPVSRVNTRAWRTALRHLPDPRAGGVPRVLLGDFNATLDHHEMRRLLGRGYLDAADATGDGLRPAWPTTGVIAELVLPRSP